MRRMLGTIVGAFGGMALGVVPGVGLGIACSTLLNNPNWAFDGLAPLACLLLSILCGMALGAVAGWRYGQRQEQEAGPTLPLEPSDERT